MLGLLAGVALMSLFSVVNVSDKAEFMAAYSGFVNSLCGIQLVFTSIILIFAITLTLIYK